MKTRLESLPYTAEDEDVWNFVGCFEAFFYGFSLEDLSADQDRRDAELMLRREIHKVGWAVLSPGIWFEDLGDDVADGCWSWQ